MIQRIIALIVTVSCSVELYSALSVNDLYKGLLYDISQNHPMQESLELLRQQKDPLSSIYEGKTLLKHCADYLSDVVRERKARERDLEKNPHDENLQSRLREVTVKENLLGETFAALLKLGKGDDGFKESLPAFMESIEREPDYNPCVVMLQDAFPEMFPEPIDVKDGDASEAEADDEKQDQLFVQPSQESLIEAFKFQFFLFELSGGYVAKLANFPFTDKELLEKDLSGKSLIRHIAECWYHEVTIESHGSYLQRRLYLCDEIAKLFAAVFKKISAIKRDTSNMQNLYAAVMDDLLENEENYRPLLDTLGQQAKKTFDDHKKLRKVAPAASPSIDKEKVYSYEIADLFYAVLVGDKELSNAFEIIKEKPYLVNACQPGGLSILNMVLVEYCCATTAKKKREFLALFFDFLLLNGADANKECTIQREIVDWWRPTEVVPWKLPSVARILEDPSLYALPVWPEGHPYKSDACQRIIKSRLDIQTAQFFHKRLAQFTSGETARFETYEGEWLRDMMPEPPVVQEQNESDDEEGGKQDQTERNKDEKESLKDLFNQLQQDPPQKSTWEKWKPSLTYFVAGATMSGLAYWLGTRSWGDPHEERRQERQRARVLRV